MAMLTVHVCRFACCGSVNRKVYITNGIKTSGSESRGQEEAAFICMHVFRPVMKYLVRIDKWSGWIKYNDINGPTQTIYLLS